jgi:hypothetical protein
VRMRGRPSDQHHGNEAMEAALSRALIGQFGALDSDSFRHSYSLAVALISESVAPPTAN